MGPPTLDIRTATESDAAALARIAEVTFRETFAQANTRQDMDAHCANNFGAARQLAEIQNANMATLIGETNGKLVAFGQLRTGVAPECVQGHRPMEIYRLYVARAWHGKGIAHQLMSALIDHAFEAGAETLWLGVWEHNPRALAFYEKFGFRHVGEHKFVLGTDEQRDLMLQYEARSGRLTIVAGDRDAR